MSGRPTGSSFHADFDQHFSGFESDSGLPSGNTLELLDGFLEELERDEYSPVTLLEHNSPAAFELRDLLDAFAPTTCGSSGTGRELPDLGDHRLIREIGRGGMGVVYEARQISLNRRVALKLLPQMASFDARHIRRFQHEAETAAHLQHPNIVPVHAIGCHDGSYFYTMPLIDGPSLQQYVTGLKRYGQPPCAATRVEDKLSDSTLLRDASEVFIAADPPELQTGPPTPGRDELPQVVGQRDYMRQVAGWGRQIAAALTHAHAEGIVHRDIKPSNVLLDREGTVWVTDFGLARFQTEVRLTRTGDLLGTLRYMSPEQARGDSEAVDHRSDIYSLGLTLFELLTLRPVYDAPDQCGLLRQLEQSASFSLRKWNPAVPSDLETIVLKALSQSPADRYGSAHELSDDLKRFLDNRPVRARRPGPLRRMKKWTLRHKSTALTLAGSSLLLLVTVAVMASYTAITRGHERDKARFNLLQANLTRAELQRQSIRVGRRHATLQTVRDSIALLSELPPSGSEFRRLRNEAVAALAVPVDLHPQLSHAKQNASKAVAFDPAFTMYARPTASYAGPFNNGHVEIREPHDDSLLAEFENGTGRVDVLGFSPDATRIAVVSNYYSSSARIRVWDWKSGEHLLERPIVNQAWDFRSDGLLAVAVPHDSRKGHVRIEFHDAAGETVSANDGDNTADLVVPFRPGRLRFHPDGERVALTRGNRIEVWHVKTARKEWECDHPKSVHGIDFSPDGQLLAAGCADHCAYVWTTRHHERQAVLSGHLSDVVEVRFNSTGRLLATGSWDENVAVWSPVTGSRQLSAHGEVPVWKLDNSQLALAGMHSVDLYTLDTSDAYTVHLDPLTTSNAPFTATYSQDGRFLATTNYTGFTLWDADSLQPLEEVVVDSSGKAPVRSALFASDGSALYTIGGRGIHRWPLQVDPSAVAIQVGPSEELFGSGDWEGSGSLSADGQTLAAVVSGDRVIVIHLKSNEQWFLAGHPRVAFVRLNHDGSLLLTGAWHGTGLQIRNTKTGDLVTELFPDAVNVRGEFHPDGSMLIASDGREVSLLSTSTWQRQWSHPTTRSRGVLAFTPSGQHVAIGTDRSRLSLIDVSTGQPTLQLDPPDRRGCHAAVFHPTVGRLIVLGTRYAAQWDCRQIHIGLTDLGLPTEPVELSSANSRSVGNHGLFEIPSRFRGTN